MGVAVLDVAVVGPVPLKVVSVLLVYVSVVLVWSVRVFVGVSVRRGGERSEDSVTGSYPDDPEEIVERLFVGEL